MLPLRVALAQIDTTIGDFAGNARGVREATARARGQGAELVVFPELTLTGYPPRDLLELRSFAARSEATLAELAAPADWSRGVAVALGFAERHAGVGNGIYNSAAILEGGRLRAVVRKRLLPTYDVFDERRTTDPGPASAPVEIAGRRVGFTICEDVWNDEAFWPHRRYPEDPVGDLVRQGIDLLVNLSASPYALGKAQRREEMLASLCRKHGVPMAYANLVGGNDQLLFDGRSLALGPKGQLLARGPAFAEAELCVWQGATEPLPAPGGEAELEELASALALGIRDYARKTHFRGALLGLSGGVDSALTACLAVRALGADAVTGIALPSRYTASISTDDAEQLARALGIRCEVVPIEPVFEGFLSALAPQFRGQSPDATEENLQARIRGTLLMALSNKRGTLLLSTGNKSELAVGYCTLYGDMAGGLAPIGDLRKSWVYRLARHLNRERPLIPERTLVRAPTAELRPGQTDQETLPPYERLDEIVCLAIEERLSGEEIVARGFPEPEVRALLGMLTRSEFKRRQAAPILRVTGRAFGDGWRFPIAQRFER
ncbi:MAG: NAD+ synthase [Deltaproteobacteria bacterium]